jgi:hypothetical protein
MSIRTEIMLLVWFPVFGWFIARLAARYWLWIVALRAYRRDNGGASTTAMQRTFNPRNWGSNPQHPTHDNPHRKVSK